MKKTTILLALALAFSNAASGQYVWKNMSAGDGTTYAIRSDGTLWSCGWNEEGQLGTPDIKERTAHFQCVGGTDKWTMAVGGKAYGFFIREDGTLWAVGTREKGVQGTETAVNNKVLTQVGTDNDWVYVTACRFWGYSGYAIKKDGTLWGWGDNSFYQLGLGNTKSQPKPVQIGTDSDWVRVTAGQDHVVALKKDGSLWGWGNNTSGGLGITDGGSFFKKPTRIGTDSDWTFVQAVDQRTYAVKQDGSLWGVGYNIDNTLGLNLPEETTVVPEYTRISAITEKVIAVSGCEWTTSVAVGENGVINKIYLWGRNADGALGNGEGIIFGSENIPFETIPVTPLLEEGQTYQSLTSGQYYSIVVTTDGKAYGWGSNKGGQLGDETEDYALKTSFHTKPIEIMCPQDAITGIEDVERVNSVFFDGMTLYVDGMLQDVRVCDITGMMVRSNAQINDSWDLSDLQSGVYLLSYVFNGEGHTQKIMIR